ncbi:TPA: lytic transglycosylase domain-containing protein [Escherichia coli]|uniref:lytic transglycosylase domain-containing protein n=2 Tax=Escherichia coli TaxID=562 RepID=UPI00022434A8|nr:transglycosylase SLT domain-containing protein [Escherichia coli]EES3796830.1 lytic transglycosylase domain-containing protein [Escherichia coli]EFG2176075.1 lytic transglycosylase domain-containing protein [Escherichia coli]EFJ3039700.1 lytic transglycosylase domain-containing protein [Escherichia coli]EFJ5715423.1 lytic transglycosylase domain-containing protein [Escherichia coli]EFK1932993.1 lytic transglycosylase domain-containing protein [Escherichia coli]
MAGNAFNFELNARDNASALLQRASEAAGSLADNAEQAAACVSSLCDGLDAVNETPLSGASGAADALGGKITQIHDSVTLLMNALLATDSAGKRALGKESQENADRMSGYFERLSRLGKDTSQHFGDIVPPLRNVGALSSELFSALGRGGLVGLTAAVGGKAVKAVVSHLYDASKAAYSLDVNARNAGMSVSAFSRFAGVFRLMGLSAEQAQAETGALFTTLNDALNTRSPEVVGILNQFGVKLAENSNHTVNLEKSTQNLTDAFGRMNSSSQKVVADALGLSDAQLALLRGTKNLNAALAESDRLKLTMPDSLNAKLVQANSNLNLLSAAWDGFTDRVKAKVLGSDAVTASVDWAVDVMSDRRSSQQKTGDHLSELRSYLYAHPEKLKSLTSRQRYNLDNNIATSDLLEMYTRLSGQRSDRLNALTATLSDDLAAALSAPSQAISQPPSSSPQGGTGHNDITPELLAHFAALEKQYNLPANTLYGLAMTESSGRADAVGPLTRYGAAKGMFQFIDPTAREFGLSGMDVFNPYRASEAAARKLAGLMAQYGGDMQRAFQAYNWGEGNMSAWLRGHKGMPQETQAYAPKVLRHMSQISGGSIITPQSGSSVADVRDEISRGFSENKIRLDINVTNTTTGQTTRRTVKGGAVSTAMDV